MGNPPAMRLHGCKATSIALCISPLTALMVELSKFSVRGLWSEFIGQLQQDVQSLSAVQKGQVQLLYVSPESILCNPQWRDMLLLPVYLIALVVDEAHCVTVWHICATHSSLCPWHSVGRVSSYLWGGGGDWTPSNGVNVVLKLYLLKQPLYISTQFYSWISVFQ